MLAGGNRGEKNEGMSWILWNERIRGRFEAVGIAEKIRKARFRLYEEAVEDERKERILTWYFLHTLKASDCSTCCCSKSEPLCLLFLPTRALLSRFVSNSFILLGGNGWKRKQYSSCSSQPQCCTRSRY